MLEIQDNIDKNLFKNSKGFWQEIIENNGNIFFDEIEDDETREYFKNAVDNLKWFKRGWELE